MRWIKTEERQPKQMQWVVIPWNGIFKVGQFDAKHPFGPAVIDHKQGKWWNGFTHWAPLSAPKS